MFRQKNRTLRHNLNLASFLSFVAGLVNVAGFLAVHRLTTNVTGHFAFFAEEVYQLNWKPGFIYLLYVLFFLFGAFVSSFIMEYKNKKQSDFEYVIPILIEAFILFLIAFLGPLFILKNPNSIAYLLLFAMGLQNSLVTTISGSVVRTTHLTGLFTDLGIELSQLFYYKKTEHRKKLLASIKLRMSIIGFFFLGGVLGGVFYTFLELHTLFIGGSVLLFGLFYDYLKYQTILMRRKLLFKKRK